jgi:two-component system sensor histidine kinase YesM
MRKRQGMMALRYGSIRNRLLAALLLTSIIPLAFLGVYSFTRYARSLERKISASNAQTLSLVNANMFTELEKYQYLCGSIAVSATVQNALRLDNLKSGEKNRIILDIQEMVRSKIIYPAQAKNITVYNRDGEIFYDLGFDGLYASDTARILEDVRANAPSDSWTYVRTYRSRDIIVLARRIMDGYSSENVLGYALVWIDEKLFSRTVLKEIELAEGSNILFMRPDGTVLSSWDRSVPLGKKYDVTELVDRIEHNAPSKSGAFDLTVNGQKQLVNYSYNRYTNLYFVSVLPFAYINSEVNAVAWQIAWITGALALISILVALGLYFGISRPIEHMVAFCRKMAGGDLSSRLEDPNRDELSYLSGRMDAMADEIQGLLSARERDDQKKRELEMQMLRYQINPHFLFNTLNSLRFVAAMNQDTVVSEGILALSSLLHSSLVDKSEYIPIGEEIANLRNYFSIQSIRFAGNFAAKYELDETLLGYLTPKLILQPLAENAIMHGFRPGGSALGITVRLKAQDDDVLMELEDDGCGFDPANAPAKGTGIGLTNVGDRLKLSFGAGYGLTIESQPGRGALCRILLPKLTLGGDARDPRPDR